MDILKRFKSLLVEVDFKEPKTNPKLGFGLTKLIENAEN